MSALVLISILESEHLTSLTALDLKLLDFRTSYMATRGGQQQSILPSSVACLNLCHASGIAILLPILLSPLLMNLSSLHHVGYTDVKALARFLYFPQYHEPQFAFESDDVL